MLKVGNKVRGIRLIVYVLSNNNCRNCSNTAKETRRTVKHVHNLFSKFMSF